MRILVIGLGSMGKRRIRILRNLYPSHELYGVDAQTKRWKEAGIEACGDLQQAFERFAPDAAFICTSPLAHAGIITQCLERKIHVFTEINLVPDQYEENMQLAQKNGCVLFLSSTFLYRNEIRYILDVVRKHNESVLYSYHVGQYLPDWHPWENYKQFFLGDKRTNGCREILAINLPWIVKCFGKVENISCMRQKITGLDIDYQDSYICTLQHENGNLGVVMADLVAREATCRLRLEGEHQLIEWHGKPDSLFEFDLHKREWKTIMLYSNVDRQQGYSANIIENAYAAEIEAFFKEIGGVPSAMHTFAEDLAVLRLIDEVEKAE